MQNTAPTSGIPSPRVKQLLQTLTIEEKLAQLQSVWLGQEEGGVVAPLQNGEANASEFTEFAKHGLGQLTRVYGTKPISPRDGLETVLSYQRWLAENTRVPIAALVHEECLTGMAAWTATTYPAPPSWGASFDPELVSKMGQAIGETMAQLGVRQGLAPVLDVMRDLRWGRIEETIAEDPYLVGEVGTAYVKGLQSAGIVATLKHFAGYSGSAAGRNHAPVHIGRRELQDVYLPPFEMAVREGGVGSVMHSYAAVDGVPAAASEWLLTQLLRDRWGFTGTVVADYFGIAFLHESQRVAASLGDAAVQALTAGVDVELPAGKAYREPLLARIAEDQQLIELVDRALIRVLNQKEQLGLLDIQAEIARLEKLLETVPETLDPPQNRALARKLADESVILVANNGLLPLAPKPGLRIAVVGPNADRSPALFGCYSFVNHVLANNPGVPSNLVAPTVLDRIRTAYSPRGEPTPSVDPVETAVHTRVEPVETALVDPAQATSVEPPARVEPVETAPVDPSPSVEPVETPTITYAQGCDVDSTRTDGFAEAVAAANDSDVVFAVLGDQAGLFGRGTSGEGCDATSLRLPGVQTELAEALLNTGKPVVLVMLTGRPYAVGDLVKRAAATVWAFFPGEEGAAAIAGVLSGTVNPSGHLPMGIPPFEGGQPFFLQHPWIDGSQGLTDVDPTPVFGFGHGLSYTEFSHSDVEIVPEASTDGWIETAVTVTNKGAREGADVVQLYGCYEYASVARPVHQLLGFARVALQPGESKRVRLRVPTTRLAFSNRHLDRVVEPGSIRVWFAPNAEDAQAPRSTVQLTGPVHPITTDSPRFTQVEVD
jgi:beta-glucosidase